MTCNSDLFADDTVFHHHIANTSDCEQLLLIASKWRNGWLVTLKPAKSEVLHVSRKNDPLLYRYSSNNELAAVDQRKHLGVWLESFLFWNYHINSICAKAKKLLGLIIRRTFGYSNKSRIAIAFKSLVKPILEYACPAWNPHLVKHVKSI